MSTQLTKPQESKALEPIDNVRTLLMKMKDQFAMALPKQIGVDRFLRTAVTSCQKTPALLECETVTLLGALMQSAQLGLIPDGILGEAYLIPYKNNSKNRMEVQLQIGYKGLKKLVHNSGEIDTFLPQVVYEGDVFAANLAEARISMHERTASSDPTKPTHFYTIVKYRSGTLETMVMTKGEIDHVRDTYSQGYKTAKKYKRDDTPWIQHYEAMAMKTVMRKHAKYLPLSTEASLAVALDERAEAGLPQDLGLLVSTHETPSIEAPLEPPVTMPTEKPGTAPAAAQPPAPVEEQPEDNTDPVDPPTAAKSGMEKRKAIYDGKCAMTCGQPIKKGQVIFYDRPAGAVFHEACIS
jgi:recombination protein RecT